MKTFLSILCGGLLIAGISGSSGNQTSIPQVKKAVVSDTTSFGQDIQPILVKNCSPCHFPGGKVYAKMPVDAPLTIVSLKKDKVLMRIKDENQKEIVRKYIELNQ